MDIKTRVYKRCEIILQSTKHYDNPFMDVDIDATFTHTDGTVIKIPGFWNGENHAGYSRRHKRQGHSVC